MSLPTFIGIGAQKCASTWIYDILHDHPQASLSDRKELDFFSHHYDRGLPWYERHFSTNEPGFAVGEISPSYFHEPAVPERVRACLPDTKIILALRDPVERAISHHKHAVRLGDISGSDLSFEAALPGNPMYLEQGRYATHLEKWLYRFPADQLLVIFFEDVARAPEDVARQVYRFLDIDPEHRSTSLDRRSNASHVIPFAGLERTRKGLRTGIHRLGLGILWDGVAAVGARRLYHHLNRRSSEEAIPTIKDETRAWLRAYFHEEVVRLEGLTGRDLSCWRAADATPLQKRAGIVSADLRTGT